MSILDECRRNFKTELRRFAALYAGTADQADIHRQRGKLHQLLADVRRSAVAVGFTTTAAAAGGLAAAPSPASSMTGESAQRNIMKGTAKRVAAARRFSHAALTSSTLSSVQQHTATLPPRSSIAALSSERHDATPSPTLRRDPRPLDPDAAVVFAEECVTAAQFLLGKGLYSEATEVCLEVLERDVQLTLREAAAHVEEQRRDTAVEPQLLLPHFDSDERRTAPRAAVPAAQASTEILKRAWRVVALYDVLRHTCHFHAALHESERTEERPGVGRRAAAAHLETVTERLMAVAAVDADGSYDILFNGTVTVYEMCLGMLRRAADGAEDTLPQIVRHVALCLEMCETATLKLATVRYLPWRLRLYDLLATCYEQRGMYAEALLVAQRAARKVRELVDLEHLDPVPPSPVCQDVMLRALDHVLLNVMRYTWCANGTVGNATGGSGGGAGDGVPQLKQSPSLTAAQAPGQQEPSMGGMPRNGLDMIDRAWQMLLKVELPKPNKAAAPATTTPKRENKGKDAAKQQQQQVDAVNREMVAERVQGALLRFLLSFTTAPSPPPAATAGTRSSAGHQSHQQQQQQQYRPSARASASCSIGLLRAWAVEALEFLVQQAVCAYVEANPTITAQGPPEEFAEADLVSHYQLLQEKRALASVNVASGRKKSVGSRRPNRSQPTVQLSISATEDEAFLGSIRLEGLLLGLAPAKAPVPVAWEGGETSVSIGSRHGGAMGEEGLLLLLLLHRVLCAGQDPRLYGRLCTCTVACLQQWRIEEEEGKRGNLTQGASSKKNTAQVPLTSSSPTAQVASQTIKKASYMRLLETVCVSVHLLQRMRRAGVEETVRIGDLAGIAQELKRLAELYIGPTAVSVTCGTQQQQQQQQSKKETVLPGTHQQKNHQQQISPPLQQRLGATMSIANSFAAVYQKLMEESANFLHQRVLAFAPVSAQSYPAAVAEASTTSSTFGGITQCEQDQDSVDMYHSIMCACLEAKANSGLTDAASIGQLVLAYARNVEAEVSTSNSDGVGSSSRKDATTRSLSGAATVATAAGQGTNKTHAGSLQRSRVQGDTMHALRRTCDRARMALSAIQMALGCLVQQRSHASKRSGIDGAKAGPTFSGAALQETTLERQPTTASSSSATAAAATTTTTGRIGTQEDFDRVRREQELRDTRTELTRWMVELRWHHAIHRQHYATLEKHRADVKLLTERQANTKVYGATTVKETNVLESLLQAEPAAPRGNADEIRRLLAWARDEGDDLLQALVLVCLAPHQAQHKVQREMMEETFHLLQRYENRRRPRQSMLSCTKQHQQQDSAYSALMIWCYAITVCGKLGFTNMTESAKDVLYAAFASKRSNNSSSNDGGGGGGDAQTMDGKPRNENPADAADTAGTDNAETTASRSSPLAVHPNEEILSVSSALQVRTLVSALLWMSTVEMRRYPYHKFDDASLMPFTEKSVMLEVPFQQRYGLAHTQLWHMRSAYRIQFAMELADRVHDNELILQCAFELFNALLPTISDENYCSLLLQPFATLCGAFLQQPACVWSNAHVQRLAVRTLDALFKTLWKMDAAGPLAEVTCADAAGVPDGATSTLAVMPASIQGWYDLLLRVFLHVWGHVYYNPNPRQLRYRQSVRQGASEVQRVLCTDLNGADGAAAASGGGLGGANSNTPANRVSASRAGRAAKAAAAAAAAAAAVRASDGVASAFPGGAYAVADTILDDCVPIEYLELLADILFLLPCGAITASRMHTTRRDKSPDRAQAIPTSAGGLVGVPAWMLDVARALSSKSPQAAFERLQQVADDPLYAKVAVCIVEYLMQQGDTTTARRVATEVLQTIQKLHAGVQEYQDTVMENMTAWLQREGYVLVGPVRQSRKTVVEEPAVKGARHSKRSEAKEAAAAEGGEGKPHDFASTGGRQWSPAEQQMLRQLTRSFAWLRRRRALRWLRGRIMQFTAPFEAKLQLYLATCAQMSLDRRRRQAQESELTSAAAAAGGGAAASPVVARNGAKSRGRGEDAAAAAAAAREEQLAEEKEDEERLAQHAARAAVLFNRCGFPSRAFAAVSQAVDGLRVFVCEEPPDMTLSDEQILQCSSGGGGGGGGHASEGATQRLGESRQLSVDSVVSSCRNMDQTQMIAVSDKLCVWGPRVLPLARALYETLLLLWQGYFDNRRDVEFLQPAAVKVGRNVLLEEQLHFQGRVPSLHAYASALGQYEEARLIHLAEVERRRLARSLVWRTREVAAVEQCGRVHVQLQWLTALHALLDEYAAALPLLEPHIAATEQAVTVAQQEEEKAQRRLHQSSGPAKAKKVAKDATNKATCGPDPIRIDNADAPVMVARRLGPALPAEKIIDNFVFLLQYMQFNCQLASLELAVAVHKLTGGLFAAALLPFTLSLQRTIGAPRSSELVEEYAQLRRDEPMHKVLVGNARRVWEQYTTTDAYRRAMQRLARTLMPSKRVVADVTSAAAAAVAAVGGGGGGKSGSFVELDRSSVASCASNLARLTGRGGDVPRVTLRDVTACFEAAATDLRQRRLFGPLAEQLYELGRIHLLHRQRAEAERFWLEAVDAALEVPESLERPPDAWADFAVDAIGLPRLLLAVLSLSSLAMYTCREQQGRAVDAYLLAAGLLERFFMQGTTNNFPKNLRDFSGFVLEDLIVLPHLSDSLQTLMPQIVHHMLFLAWELLKFKFPLYAAMVASLTEYLARKHTRHIAFTVEARLVQASAASQFGSHRAAMKILHDVCYGVRIPSGALDSTTLRLRAAVECGEAVKMGKGGKRGEGGLASSSRQIDGQGGDAQQTQLQQQQQQHAIDTLYDDSELPVSAGNVASVQAFVSQCLCGATGGDAAASAAPSSSTSTTAISGLHEAVAAAYGSRLSLRVELAVVESLVALGSKEAAYVWCAFAMHPQAVPGERRGVRSRSFQRMPLHSFSASASLEALNLAEMILQSLLLRVQARPSLTTTDAAATTVNNSISSSSGSKKNLAREKSVSPASSPEDVQAKRNRELEETYVCSTAELLLAKIFTARGECTKALAALQSLMTNFNERTGPGAFSCSIPNVPSYLWTVTTHTFWCDVYALMTLNHVRLQEYGAAQEVVNDALALCDQCGDAYSGRVFSLYNAALAVRAGAMPKVAETLQALQRVRQSLRCDSRVDMLHAWTVVATEMLRRQLQGGNMQQEQEGTSSAAERMEEAVSALRAYCKMHGLRPDNATLFRAEQKPRPLVAWSIDAVFLHRALNILAEEYMAAGKLELAEKVLQQAISGLAPQYDTAAHPTLLIDSRFMLARVLCLLTPALLVEQQKAAAMDVSDAVQAPEPCEEDVLAALDSPRQQPVRLLLDVVQHTVASGTHDYNTLRLALLYLAVLLLRAGRSFYVMAATCAVLAKLVEDMRFHVFSGTSVFSLYGEEAINLGVDMSFSESIIAVIQSTQRDLGHARKKGGTDASNTATPVPGSVTPDSRRTPSRNREEREKAQPKNMVPLSVVVAAFAALHRESALQCVFPPLESLDLETALRHLRAYLQVKTAPLSCCYLWYDEATRETHIKQQQQQQQHGQGQGQGRLGESTRGGRGAVAPTEIAGATVSLLPPIVIDGLPHLFSSNTLTQLGVPKANTVICQSFVRDANVSRNKGPSSSLTTATMRRKSGVPSAVTSISAFPTPGMLTCVLFVSPVYDPSVVQPPTHNEKVPQSQGKKSHRTSGKNTAASEAKTDTDPTSTAHPWGGTQCVVFELPLDEVQTLQAQATQTLQLMRGSSTLVTLTTRAGTGDAAGGESEVPVGVALSQQLTEALAVLNTKLAPASSSKKFSRAPASVEFMFNNPLNATTNSSPTLRQSTTTGGMDLVTGAADFTAADGAAAAAEVPAVDEAKSKLVIGFIELLVRAVVPRAVTDDELMERSVQSLLPRCAVSVEVVRFLQSVIETGAGGVSLFHPGIHEWFARVAGFVAEHV